MANAPAPIGIAPRYQKPAAFQGTDVAWRVLCDLYPSAETPEVILAVVEYCAARRLDPLRKPVHVVPMWNARLRRRVQVVMQGINELETTAHRTGLWAGMDEPRFGPMQRKAFKGSYENDDGTKRETEVELEFPEYCAVTVWRLVAGERRAFTEPVWWIEAYGRAGFRSEVPNARWTQAPRQMLHKCAKAASLRAAFPEEVGSAYTDDEMEGREIDAGGMTIEGRVDHGDPGLTERDRQIEQTPSSQPPGDPGQGLDEPNGTKWLANLTAMLAAAKTAAWVDDLRKDERVVKAVAKAPVLIKRQIEDLFTAAHKRIAAAIEEAAEAAIDEPGPPDDEHDWQDPIAGLLAELATMDLITIAALPTNAEWRVRVREATTLPLDADRLNDAIAARKTALEPGR